MKNSKYGNILSAVIYSSFWLFPVLIIYSAISTVAFGMPFPIFAMLFVLVMSFSFILSILIGIPLHIFLINKKYIKPWPYVCVGLLIPPPLVISLSGSKLENSVVISSLVLALVGALSGFLFWKKSRANEKI